MILVCVVHERPSEGAHRGCDFSRLVVLYHFFISIHRIGIQCAMKPVVYGWVRVSVIGPAPDTGCVVVVSSIVAIHVG